MRTTIRDVAEAAGVSAMAVSAVLNGAGRNVKVSAEKAEHIRRIAKELRYQPNHVARSLRNRKTRMVGLVFQHFERLGEENPYYPQLLNGAMNALFSEDYTLALCPKMILGGHADSVSDGRFDGVLWCRPDFTEASVKDLSYSSVPVVMMHAQPGTIPGVTSFCADNEGALRLVIDHLSGLGHQNVVFAIEPMVASTAEGQLRGQAFLAACSQHGVSGTVEIWTDLEADLVRHTADDAPVTAVVAFSDTLAGLILRAASRLNIAIPERLSVVGFDSSSFCEGTKPRLTSVFQPVERMSYAATKYLLALINEVPDAEPGETIYACTLDVRDSTAPPRSQRREIHAHKSP